MSTDTDEIMIPPPPKPAVNWMITFADLLSLTLTFFVLLFSMSSVEHDKWEGVVDSLIQRLNPNRSEFQGMVSMDFQVERTEPLLAMDLDYLYAILTEKIKRHPQLSPATLKHLDDRLIISFDTELLFEADTANLIQDSLNSLELLGAILGQLGNKIDVIGHTAPASGNETVSTWQLSLSRALVIAELLNRTGYLHSVNAFGLADSRFHELPESMPLPERIKRAQRVDIEIRPTSITDTGS